LNSWRSSHVPPSACGNERQPVAKHKTTEAEENRRSDVIIAKLMKVSLRGTHVCRVTRQTSSLNNHQGRLSNLVIPSEKACPQNYSSIASVNAQHRASP